MLLLVFVKLKWLSYTIFIVLLATKLQFYHLNSLPWPIVFFPSFLNDMFNLMGKVHESRGYFKSTVNGSKVLAMRQLACSVDQCGSLLGSISLSIFLEMFYYDYFVNNVSFLFIFLLPLWLSIIISTSIRIVSLVMNRKEMMTCSHLNKSIRPSSLSFSVLNMVAQLLIRGLQPVLIVLRVSDFISQDWGAVFCPLWLMVFMGISLGTIPIACVRSLHIEGSVDLREQASRLVYMVATHVILLDIAVLISLMWLSRSRGDIYLDLSDSANLPALHVFSPIIAVFAFFALLHPTLLEYVNSYQVFLRGVHHQDLQQALSAATKQQAVLSVVLEKTWLLQVSSTLYHPLDCAERLQKLDNMILLRSPQDSDALLLGTTLEDCIGICLFACSSSGRFTSGWTSQGARKAVTEINRGSDREVEGEEEVVLPTGFEMAVMRRQSMIDRDRLIERGANRRRTEAENELEATRAVIAANISSIDDADGNDNDGANDTTNSINNENANNVARNIDNDNSNSNSSTASAISVSNNTDSTSNTAIIASKSLQQKRNSSHKNDTLLMDDIESSMIEAHPIGAERVQGRDNEEEKHYQGLTVANPATTSRSNVAWSRGLLNNLWTRSSDAQDDSFTQLCLVTEPTATITLNPKLSQPGSRSGFINEADSEVGVSENHTDGQCLVCLSKVRRLLYCRVG
jgi:hypothetical protein